MVNERQKKGQNYGIILIPEGLIEFIPEINSLISEINKIMAKIQESEIEEIRKIVL